MNRKLMILSLLCILCLPAAETFAMSSIEAPGQALTGYGSSTNYICSSYKEYRVGDWYDPWSGDWCWYYVPEKLKNGTSAPVAIILHGMMLMAPDIYKDQIAHLCKQGYIVLFPQINKGGLAGLATDNDQNLMMHRTIDSVNTALDALGSKADRDNLVLYGHSLGGLIAMCWAANEGTAIAPPVKSMVLVEPCIYSAIPAFVDVFVTITELDFITKAQSATCPVIMITGEDDSIAPPSTAIEAYDALSNVSSKALYQVYSDRYGDDELIADHMAPICDDGWMPSWAMDMLGGDGEVDTLDYRVFWTAMDAAFDRVVNIDFDMGAWSDGTPVLDVEKLRP